MIIGIFLVYHSYILSVLPTGAKLFSEVWSILSGNGKFMQLSFYSNKLTVLASNNGAACRA